MKKKTKTQEITPRMHNILANMGYSLGYRSCDTYLSYGREIKPCPNINEEIKYWNSILDELQECVDKNEAEPDLVVYSWVKYMELNKDDKRFVTAVNFYVAGWLNRNHEQERIEKELQEFIYDF